MAELTINTADITAAIKKNLDGFAPDVALTQVGRVIEVGDVPQRDGLALARRQGGDDLPNAGLVGGGRGRVNGRALGRSQGRILNRHRPPPPSPMGVGRAAIGHCEQPAAQVRG